MYTQGEGSPGQTGPRSAGKSNNQGVEEDDAEVENKEEEEVEEEETVQEEEGKEEVVGFPQIQAEAEHGGSFRLPPAGAGTVASSCAASTAGPSILPSFSEKFYAGKKDELGDAFHEARVKYVELVDPELLKTSSEEGRDSVLYECSTFEVRKSTGESSPSRIIVVKKGVKVWVLPGTWAMIMVIQLDKG